MTEEKIRIACAELEGCMHWSYALPQGTVACSVPHYTTLDDISRLEAEVGLHDKKNTEIRHRWGREMFRILSRRIALICITTQDIAFATALERRETVLRATNKWKD